MLIQVEFVESAAFAPLPVGFEAQKLSTIGMSRCLVAFTATVPSQLDCSTIPHGPAFTTIPIP